MAAFLEQYVVTPKGAGAGEPFRLRPWQAEIVAALFNEPRPRGGLMSIPRGNGKTTLAAAFALFADGEPSPQVLVVARTRGGGHPAGDRTAHGGIVAALLRWLVGRQAGAMTRRARAPLDRSEFAGFRSPLR